MHALATPQIVLSRLMALLSVITAASMLFYGVFLLFAVSHTAARTAAQRDTQEIASQISVLEGEYFNATKAITPQLAHDLGFSKPASTHTVFATAASKVLTLEALGD